MRNLCKIAVVATLFATSLPATTIFFNTTTHGVDGLGDTILRNTYDLRNVILLANQELSIRFPALVYKSLFNGVAPGGGQFDLLVLPVNSPPGATGDYSLLALVNNPAMTGVFSVDFTLQAGQAAGSQQFLIFNASGGQIESGNTTALGNQNSVPEPMTLSMAAVGLVAAWAARRSRPTTTNVERG